MQILTPDISNLDEIVFTKPIRKPFDDEVLSFINSLSKKLVKESKFREYSELVALGFWLRFANMQKLKDRFFKQYKGSLLLPRGVVFHVAPSNVDTIFLYSFILSLLVGNHNIVRITQKHNPQIDPLLDLVVQELKNHQNLYNSTVFIRYAHEDNITEKLSNLCDVRIIWGGDSTIKHIRTIPIKPTAIELTFADKFSFFVLNLNNVTLDELFFEKLYSDSFTFMQNACSSIKCICFLDATQEQKNFFWQKFSSFIQNKKPELEAKTQIDKLVALSSLSIDKELEKLSFNPYLSYVSLHSLKDIDEATHCGGGLFYDVNIKSIDELLRFSTKKHQTLVVAGISKEQINKAFSSSYSQGFDRVVSLGKSMEFNAIWDGFDIMSSLCRVIDVDI
jgi:hypothetical protein